MKEKKNKIRKEIKEIKSLYSFEELKEKSVPIFKFIEEENEFKNASIVLVYWSMKDEVFTHDFVEKWSKTKTILLPVIQGDILKLKHFTGISTMKPEPKFGILEPIGEEFTDFKKIDYIIVPGLAFDLNNNRLGHGKGYYDKLLPKILQAKKVGICFDFQLIDEVPVDNFDVIMDVVYSENV